MDLFNKTKKKYNVNKSRQIKQTKQAKQTKHKSHNIKNLRIKKIKTKKISLYTKKNNKHRIHNSDNDNDSDNDSIKSDNKHQIGGGLEYIAYYHTGFLSKLRFKETQPKFADINPKTIIPTYQSTLLLQPPIIKIKNYSDDPGTYTFSVSIKHFTKNMSTFTKLWTITKTCTKTFFSVKCGKQTDNKAQVSGSVTGSAIDQYIKDNYTSSIFIIQIDVTFKNTDSAKPNNNAYQPKYCVIKLLFK